ncbi:MAG: hypothetical protein HDQ90_02905 [Desulfovibrio sp.]|nr:hypothetical protein [Desulfovibrio sp.]
MGFFDGLASMMTDSAGKNLINQHIAKYGRLTSLSIRDGQVRAGLLLNGIDQEIAVSCASVDIAEDGSTVRLGGFSANVPCVEQALNDFCTRTFEVKSPRAQYALTALRKLLF